MDNAAYLRKGLQQAGFDIKPGESAIVPVMLYDAALSQKFAQELLIEGIYAIGFYYPVVPKGEARIRVQLSAAHSQEHLDAALQAFVRVGKKLNVIS
jgi:glycine C-acetyltransferase